MYELLSFNFIVFEASVISQIVLFTEDYQRPKNLIIKNAFLNFGRKQLFTESMSWKGSFGQFSAKWNRG